MQIIRAPRGLSSAGLSEPRNPAIGIGDELTPSDTGRMLQSLVLGFVTRRGGKSSHVAIIARTPGTPSVVGAGKAILNIAAKTFHVLDETEGVIIIDIEEIAGASFERL